MSFSVKDMMQQRNQLLEIVANATEQLEKLNEQIDRIERDNITVRIKQAYNWVSKLPGERLVGVSAIFGYNEEGLTLYDFIDKVFKNRVNKPGIGYYLPGAFPKWCNEAMESEDVEKGHDFCYLDEQGLWRLNEDLGLIPFDIDENGEGGETSE